MNIWQRFKNWLIKKLGGYTEEKLIEEVDKGVELAMYWHQRYNIEHENYLALLNCHNATAEAVQNVAIAADTIKDYCANRADCDGCPLHGECGCKTADKACPEYWD